MARTKARKTTGEKSNLWKDYFGSERVRTFAEVIKKIYPRFNIQAYLEAVYAVGFDSLELKERIRRLAECLRDFLPGDYSKATNILIQAAPHLPEFENWILTSYVELYGFDDFDESIETMRQLTSYGTAEFAIRPFIIEYPDRMMSILHRWAGDSNEHVRRLAAEASRPRGVWVPHIRELRGNPRPVLELLDKLKTDESLYVRKAVANNLNDISKDHPDLVLATCRRWSVEGSSRTAWIVRHGCRTLLRRGHPEALALLGFTSTPRAEVLSFRIKPARVRIGSDLSIELRLKSSSKRNQRLAIDYRIHYVKANGDVHPKVFKWTEKTLYPDTTLTLSKRQSLRPMSTRRHYCGIHRVELLINGLSFANTTFRLVR